MRDIMEMCLGINFICSYRVPSIRRGSVVMCWTELNHVHEAMSDKKETHICNYNVVRSKIQGLSSKTL